MEFLNQEEVRVLLHKQIRLEQEMQLNSLR